MRTSKIVGTVTDSQGNPLEGVGMTVRQERRRWLPWKWGIINSGITDSFGAYEISDLPLRQWVKVQFSYLDWNPAIIFHIRTIQRGWQLDVTLEKYNMQYELKPLTFSQSQGWWKRGK